MLRNAKKLATLALILLLSSPVTAFAHDVPQLDHLCSLTITMKRAGKPVHDGRMELYRVGEVAEDDGNYSFRLTKAFTPSGVSLENLNDSALADDLAAYAASEKLKSLSAQTIDEAGKATFTQLEVGLYLIVQTKPAKGYASVDPFLVSLPYLENGVYVYDREADPKTSLEPVPTTSRPTTPTTKPGDKLPQTGDPVWLAPAFACAGAALIFLGLAKSPKKKRAKVILFLD